MSEIEQEKQDGSVRLAKYLASAGIASRRSCEELIAQGYVRVNDEPVLTPAFTVVPGRDVVTYRGKEVTQDASGERVYLILHKPDGYTCSAKDEHASKLIFDLVPEKFGRLFSVGRLDRNSEGLIILTNDGDFAQRMTHPSHQVPKRYLVECEGQYTTSVRREMMEGVYDGGDFLRAIEVKDVKVMRGHCTLEITLTEGKKREVRRMCRSVGLAVASLKRIAFGTLELGNLQVGCWRLLSAAEINALLTPPERPAHRFRPAYEKRRPLVRRDMQNSERRGAYPADNDTNGGSPAPRRRPASRTYGERSDDRQPREDRGGYRRGEYGTGADSAASQYRRSAAASQYGERRGAYPADNDTNGGSPAPRRRPASRTYGERSDDRQPREDRGGYRRRY